MRAILRGGMKSLLLAVAFSLTAFAAQEKPNIVLIVSDDQGWNDVGYHGSEFSTPNIDRIAREGVELDRFYGTPICTPTRAGLMTGRYPIRFGIQRVTIKRWGGRSITAGEVLVPGGLAKAGYSTRAMLGKWHLGWSKRAHHPMSRGFTSFYGLGGGAIGYFGLGQFGIRDWHRDWMESPDEGYSTTLIGQEAARIIEAEKNGEPFFLYVAFNAIHSPNDYENAQYERFAHIKNEKRRQLAAMTASLDAEIGRILNTLDRKGMSDDTLVWFLCDNGGVMTDGPSSFPLRDGKWSVYEGGIRLASAVRWPNGLDDGRKLTEPVSYIDVFPTLMHVAGVSDHGGQAFDGEDVWEVIRGERTRDDWELHSYFQGQRIPQNNDPNLKLKFERNAVNTKHWKLVRLGPDIQLVDDPRKDAQLELYRIDDDISESRNLAEQHPYLVENLLAKMVAFRHTQKKQLDNVTIQPGPDWKPTSFAIPAE